jgi:hypothetical protein
MPSPQKLNYEKTLYPFILFSKKRYVGNLYEFDINKFKQKSMGIVLKRRDNANIVKKIYGGIIDIILNKQDLKESIVFLREELSNLVEGKTKIEDLVISKSLKGSYVDPTKIAHKVLADRIAERDPGNRPKAGDRIPYVYKKLTNDELDKLKTLNYYEFSPAGNFGYTKAEVTRGGINTDELNHQTFESKFQKNLYFIGECLDITGQLGGFNFQIVFAQSYLCAKNF